ncbi:hypothetical protein ABZ729_15685 [Streptomyces sp. NPDC006678]|uniref:hypothetical protein n=1 Tax=Streptomyces sp. NPDC006678 TaxID=3157185 RepID=UPI003410B341
MTMDSGQGAANFSSTPTQKKAAAGTIENELEPNTKKAAERADTATGSARKGGKVGLSPALGGAVGLEFTVDPDKVG